MSPPPLTAAQWLVVWTVLHGHAPHAKTLTALASDWLDWTHEQETQEAS